MKNLYIINLLIVSLLLSSCNTVDTTRMFVGNNSRVNDRFESSMKYLSEHPIADITVDSDEYKALLLTDIHYPASPNKLSDFVSACLADQEVEHFVLCLGDLVNGKDLHKTVNEILTPIYYAGWKFFCTTGNHDLYFNSWSEYSKYWPLCTYTFKVYIPDGQYDFFIAVDSAEGTIGTKQREWLENQLASVKTSAKLRNIYMLTHSNFFNTDNSQITSGNLTLEETYDLMSLLSNYGVSYVLTGHDHYYEHVTFRGVEYYTLNSMKDQGSYYQMTFGDELRFKEIVLR